MSSRCRTSHTRLLVALATLLVLMILPQPALAFSPPVPIWNADPGHMLATQYAAPSDVFVDAHNEVNFCGSTPWVIGGTSDYAHTNLINTVEWFNYLTQKWTMAPPLAPGLSRFNAGCAGTDYGGMVYVFGGRWSPNPVTDYTTIATGSVVFYNTYTSGSGIDGNLVVPRYAASAAWGGPLVGNQSEYYVVGGWGNANPTQQLLSSIEEYDAYSHTSRIVATLPQGVANPTVFVIGQKLYVFGGRLAGGTFSNQGYVVDLSGAYPGGPTPYPVSSAASMPYGRMGGSVKTADNSWAYLCGGPNGTTEVEAYDPTTDEWGLVGTMPKSAIGSYQFTTNSGVIYVFGGWDSNGVWQDLALTSSVFQTLGGQTTAATPGSPQTLSTGGQSVGVELPAGSTAGNLTVTLLGVDPSTFPYGVGFSLGSGMFDIATDSTGWNTLGVTITLPYDPNISDTFAQTAMDVMHWNGTAWVAIPRKDIVSVDTTNHTITFVAYSLSPFAVARPMSGVTPTPASSPLSLAIVSVLGATMAMAMVAKARVQRAGR